jgi:anti-sigma B factor antagonist
LQGKKSNYSSTDHAPAYSYKIGPFYLGLNSSIPHPKLVDPKRKRSRSHYDELAMPNNAPPILTLDIDRNAHPIVVHLHGKLVSGVGDILYDQVRPLLPDHKRIILDLTDLVRVDSMGLGTLARLYVSARTAGCSLQLINLGKQVRLLLDTAHLLEAFTSLANTALR